MVKPNMSTIGTGEGTVEPLNKGHFGTALFVLCKEVVLIGRSKMHKSYREELFWDPKLCPL